MRNAERMHNGLSALGLKLGSDVSSVIAVVAPDPQTAVTFWRGLIEAGVYVNLALPPATPFGYSLLRASLCAAHTEGQIDQIISVFADVAGRLGLIERPAAKRIAAG